jgi:TP901 family phage tail tape measure protein
MLANQIAVMNRSFSDTLRSTGQFSTHFVSLQSDVEKFGRNLDGGKLKLNQYFNTFRDHARTSGGVIRDLAKQQVALQNAVLQPLGRNSQGLMQFNVHVPRGLNEIKNKTAIARQELQIMNKVIQDGAGQLINWGKNTQWAGRQLTVGLTVPLAAFGKAAADAFRQADQELVRLTKVYGDVAGTSAEELGRVRKEVTQTAKDISAAMGVSFKETIGLAADIAATGKTGDELLGSIKETTRLAVLGEVDRQDAMKATLAIQSAFKQNTDQLSESINFLNAVENQTSTSLNDLVEAIPKAGPVIQGLGGSVQDLALYLTAMREGGINASEGANALKSALASLINPTDVAVGKFKTLGIDLLGIVNNNAGNLTGTLMALQGALDTLDPLKKQQAIEQLFGKFQFARLNALFENLGRQGSQTLQVLDLMKASSEDLAAVAGRELSQVTESASGKYRRALESLKASLAEVGEQFLTINTVLIQVIDKVLQFANNLPGPVKQVMALLGGVTAVIGPFIMLTGVLANFFGYILKGIFHMKAFFKGGEGWKYLTPEMLAAEKAGKLVEQTFYSDAKAAAVLQQALRNLIDEFAVLESKAKSGAIGVSPAVSTMGGNLIMGAGGRVVNPNHPLAGAYGSRASTHMVARSGMTEEQRLQQTMFGMVPGSGPVNQKIGQSPQIYMNDPLPNVSGLTNVNGVSTGVVAGEAARWHAMMGTLGMQSKAEIEQLKKTIVATGTVNKEFMTQFDDILPIVSKLTDNAARESALIVSELRAGKITVEAAKAKIIALNLETERMIASSMQAQATSMGRTFNPTMVPTLNQPVVDPTGKSNMRELFKKGKTRDFINKVAGVLGVRTSGAGYNVETTMPRKMNSGGYVYTMNDGNIVPGPNVNRDVVPAMLTPGEFVVNKESTAANLPLLRSINSQSGSDLPIGYMPPKVSDSVLGIFGERPRSRGSSSPGTLVGRWGMIMPETINGALAQKLNSPGAKGSDLLALLQQPDRLIDLEDFLSYNGVDPKDIDIAKRRVAADMARQIQPNGYYADGGFGQIAMSSTKNVVSRLENKYPGISLKFQKDRMTPGRRDTIRRARAGETQAQANARGGGSPTGINYKNQRPSNYGAGASRGSAFGSNQVWGHFGDQEMQKNTSMLSRAFGFARRTPNLMAMRNPGPSRAMSFIPGLFRNSGGIIGMNAGGMVPGYNRGGGPITDLRMRGMWPGQASSNLNYQGGDLMPGPAPRRVMGTGMVGGLAGSIGGGAIGGAVGGSTGSLIGSIAGGFLPQMIKSVVQIISKMGVLVKSAGGVLGVVKNIGMFLKSWSIPGAILTVLGFIVKKFFDWRKEVAETKREQTNLFGITEKSAKEAGITYVSLTDKIKALREEQKLAADKAKAYFESYTSSGVAGLTLTIQQLRELKERVKTDMPELIATFNSIDSSKVNDLASNLKAQMVASGQSVEEATNLIYALIEASDKAGMGVSAITTRAFNGITDQGSAAGFVMENLAKNIKDVSSIDPSAFASNVDTAISSLESAVKSLVGTKDSTGKMITESQAVAMQFERMTKSGIKNKELGKETLAVLKAQRPEFANILNKSETIGGMYAKWRLVLQGVKIDLSQISSAQAEALATFMAGLDTAAIDALSSKGTVKGLEEARAALGKLQTDYDKANKASQQNNIDAAGLSKNAIKGIQAEIKAIKERADAKKKALRETFDKENAELELQQAKLELQSAVARGDKDAAASAQIRIQQIQKEAALKKAENNIDTIAAKEEAKQQAMLDKDAAYKDKLNEAMQSNQNKAAGLGTTIKTVNELGASITNAAKLLAIASNEKATDAQKSDFKIAFANALNDIAKAAKSDPKVLEAYGQFLDRKDTGKKDKNNNPIYEYTKDSEGNFMPGKANEEYLRKTGGRGKIPGGLVPEGSALKEIKEVSKGMTDFATSVMGDGPYNTLSAIYNVLSKGSPGGKAVTVEDLTKALNSGKYDKYLDTGSAAEMKSKGFFNADGSLKDNARELAIRSQELQAGEQFNTNGTTYNVKTGFDSRLNNPRAVRKAMGGYVVRAASGVSGIMGSQPYLVGERGPELFVPSSGGQIIPNNILGASYNIPKNPVNSVGKGANNSFNNNVYNIDIDLNGTNVTVNDIMRELDSRMALIGAKEGRVRTFGGLI